MHINLVSYIFPHVLSHSINSDIPLSILNVTLFAPILMHYAFQ